jgi:hypothetical protein
MKNFDFRKNHLFINGVEVSGYGKGDDVLSIERMANLADDEVGADGRMTVSLNADKRVKVTVKLNQTSPDNARFSKVARNHDSADTFTPVTGAWQDSYRNDSADVTVGYMVKHSDIKRGAHANETETVFIFERGDLLLGDPIFAGLPVAAAEALRGI